VAKNALGHRAAADIASANEKNGLHQKVWKKLSPVNRIVNPEYDAIDGLEFA